MNFRRPSRREHLIAVKAQLEGLARMAGREPVPYLTQIPEQRAQRQPSLRPVDKPLEKHVLRAVLKYLRGHPKVACVWRMQSGVFHEDDRTITVGVRGLPDVICMLRGGRLMAVEVKSQTGIVTESQQYWIDTINYFGGIAGVVRSVDEVEALLAERIING